MWYLMTYILSAISGAWDWVFSFKKVTLFYIIRCLRQGEMYPSSCIYGVGVDGYFVPFLDAFPSRVPHSRLPVVCGIESHRQ